MQFLNIYMQHIYLHASVLVLMTSQGNIHGNISQRVLLQIIVCKFIILHILYIYLHFISHHIEYDRKWLSHFAVSYEKTTFRLAMIAVALMRICIHNIAAGGIYEIIRRSMQLITLPKSFRNGNRMRFSNSWSHSVATAKLHVIIFLKLVHSSQWVSLECKMSHSTSSVSCIDLLKIGQHSHDPSAVLLLKLGLKRIFF